MDAKAKYLERPWLKSYIEGMPADIDISVAIVGL